MSLNDPTQVTSVDTSLINMSKVLGCLVEEFAETAKPVNYTALESCVEERGLHGSRYIYAALKKARNLGYVKFIERKSGGTWKLYVPTLRGIIANYAFNLAFWYKVPELYELIMEYTMWSIRMAVDVLRKWRELMDKEGVNYNRNYIESVIHIHELMLSAFKEDVPGSLEELRMVMKHLSEFMNVTFYYWFERGLGIHFEAAGVPKEVVDKVIRPTPDELYEFYSEMGELGDVTTNQQAQDPQTQP